MKDIGLIPKPRILVRLDGHFTIPTLFTVAYSTRTATAAQILQEQIHKKIGIPCQLNPGSSGGNIKLDLSREQRLGNETYQLIINRQGITISAASRAGIFYGLQTLMQLMLHFETESQIPCLEIEDGPQYSWRGFMLDEARHFHGKDQTKRLLDIMAHYKMNIFHWHLADDQGWRVEIKRYPRLTKTGAVRPGTSYSFFNKKHNGIPHSGFYTQDDIAEIVAYAAERHITIVPEIDIPGHSLAALAAYPEFSCTGNSLTPATGPGIYSDIYCVGKEKTFEFLENIFQEILSLFPAQYIHFGGDETPIKRWKACPDCQNRAKNLGIDLKDLQVYFTNRMAEYLFSQGKQVIGWSEVLHPRLVDDIIVQAWLPRPGEVIQTAQNKRKLIVSLMTATYLDQTYPFIPLKKAYLFNPLEKGLSQEDSQQILGIEAPLWSEYVWNSSRLDYQVFPRLLAYAETGWTSPGQKDYSDFEERLISHLPWLNAQGIKYAPPEDWNPAPWKKVLSPFSVVKAKNQTSTGISIFPG